MSQPTEMLLDYYANLIKRIQEALGTEENDEALIEVARNAKRCELELTSTYNFDDPFTIEGDEGAI